MDLRLILERVCFVDRYQSLCAEYNDMENSMRGNDKELYKDILNKLGHPCKYYSKGSFFKISDNGVDLHLVLKDGLVESLLYVYVDGHSISPKGRFDAIAEMLQTGFREKYNIPKYSTALELEMILKEIISIYVDIKSEFNRLANFRPQ